VYEVSDDQLVDVAARIAADATVCSGSFGVLPVVGLKEIGLMFRVGWNTPYQWRTRKQLPAEDDLISGNPVWRLPTIYAWAAETNRKIRWDPWGLFATAVRPNADGDAEPADARRPVAV
jgi:hypothetical protein